MVRILRSFFLSLSFCIPLYAATVRGIVVAPDAQPIAGAVVSVDTISVRTLADGRFTIEVPDGAQKLHVSRDGFAAQTSDIANGNLTITMKPALAESIVVSGIRAEHETPVTKTDLTRPEIEKSYFGQDVPLLLRETPSINAYAEGGIGGAGYSYITLRGISPTRLNFTFDGVPLADPEDMGTYFVDFPDLAHSLESIQVQRGVGTSTFGSASFGGSINMESIALSQERSTEAWLGAGSFGTKLASVGYQTGALPGGFLGYGRISFQDTDGFREHSGVSQHNFFFSGAKQGEESQLKITGFAGHESQHLSFYASDEATLHDNLRDNPLSADDRDSFGYNLAEVQYLRKNVTASVYFQRGYGWYSLAGDRYAIDGLLFGGMLARSASWKGISANYGVHVNEFKRDHTLDSAGERLYANYGTKGEANGFAKFNYDVDRWRLYADLQLRTTDFHYHGDVAIDPMRWTFFNPKIGARYDISSATGVYASAGISRREPTRNDLFQGEDNASISHDLRAVRPERLFDLEAGWDYRTARGSIGANVYAMEFHDEIAATGELSDIGLALRRNVDRSYRRGFEIENSWQVARAVRLRGNANFSSNRIAKWTQFYDVYDAAGNITGSRAIEHRDVHPVASPSVLINESVDYAATSRLSLTATGRYAGKTYLDNTNDAAFTTPSFFSLDAGAAWTQGRTKLSLQVNNALDSKRIFPSGYSYQFITPSGAVDGIRYFYPQATRNFVITLDYK
jgi:iron complex outermembrane receptor protein